MELAAAAPAAPATEERVAEYLLIFTNYPSHRHPPIAITMHVQPYSMFTETCSELSYTITTLQPMLCICKQSLIPPPHPALADDQLKQRCLTGTAKPQSKH